MLHDHACVGPTAIRTRFGAIFVSLELSRSKWVLTSLSPGNGEKMSQSSLAAGDIGRLLARFADLKRKARQPTGSDYPIIPIHEAGLDGFWVHRVLQDEGIEGHAVEPFEACSTFTRVTARTLAESLHDPFHRRLQPGRYLPDCSDCYRPERLLPEGTCTLSRTVPFHGTRL